MTTTEIIAAANFGGIAAPDMDLSAILVYAIAPEVETETGSAWWRRAVTAVDIVAGERRYALPHDLRSIISVRLSEDGDDLQYIGEDPAKVLAAESATAETPTGYLVEVGGPGGEPYGLAFNRPPQSSGTAYIRYRRAILTPEDGSGLDLVARMPRELHWCLVEGLKREIYLERAGKDDTRFVAAASNFEMWKQRAAAFSEAGRAGSFVKSIF